MRSFLKWVFYGATIVCMCAIFVMPTQKMMGLMMGVSAVTVLLAMIFDETFDVKG